MLHTIYAGNLSLSRAIGDFEFKKDYSLEPEKQIITSNPDIMEHAISEEDEFLVIACDGMKHFTFTAYVTLKYSIQGFGIVSHRRSAAIISDGRSSKIRNCQKFAKQ